MTPGWGSNPRPPDREANVLTTRPSHRYNAKVHEQNAQVPHDSGGVWAMCSQEVMYDFYIILLVPVVEVGSESEDRYPRVELSNQVGKLTIRQRCQVFLFCSILYCFLMKILPGFRKILFFYKFITTHVYCTMGENTVFFIQNTYFLP